jgi:two-component system, NtrC family, response regulator PilR
MSVHSKRILIVDDEPALRQMLQILFSRQGFETVLVPGVRAAQEAIQHAPTPFPAVLTDLLMPDGSGLDVLGFAKARTTATEVIVMTAHSSVDAAVDAMRKGAYDFITKPFVPAELSALVHKALEKSSLVEENARLRAKIAPEADTMLGRSGPMRRVADLISKVAAGRTTVLITGESGTGKERVAKAIHEASDRRDKPFLVVNCGALPEQLMESELFGHERGAFTGASARHGGIFRDADGGTVFLDEIGELPLPLQVKLLRVLQERKIRPVGATQETAVDVRIVAATNRDIEAEVETGRFRQDLYYRLNVIRFELPPLRERAGDVAELAAHFLKKFAVEAGKDVRGFSADTLRALDGYAFPGNVRELENIVERAVALAGSPLIGLGDLPASVSGLAGGSTVAMGELPEEGCKLDEVLGELERRLMLQALERTGGVKKRASKLLGVSFRSLRYRLAKYGLDDDSDDDEPITSDIEIPSPGVPVPKRVT